MNRFYVGLGVTAVLMTIALVVLAWVMKRPGGADAPKLPEPVSYAKPSPDGTRVFVAHGSLEYETSLKDADTRAYAAGVRAKYPAPGIYSAGDNPTLLAPDPRVAAVVGGLAHPEYVLPFDQYTPDENVFLTRDGGAVARIEGGWWKTKAYPAGKRLPDATVEEQMNAPGATFLFADRLPRTHLLKDLVDWEEYQKDKEKDKLPHSPEHVLWPAGAALDPNTNRFHLFTQDSNKVTFDATTGEVVHKGKNGWGNPVAKTVLAVVVGLTAILMAVLAWYIVKARPKPA
jgi:hypothetical protein